MPPNRLGAGGPNQRLLCTGVVSNLAGPKEDKSKRKKCQAKGEGGTTFLILKGLP
jgi:hypothetical protein